MSTSRSCHVLSGVQGKGPVTEKGTVESTCTDTQLFCTPSEIPLLLDVSIAKELKVVALR